MKFLLPLALLALAACGGEGFRVYQNNDLQLITAYSAKTTCSCVFVMEMPEDYCRAYARQNPAVATVSIDRAAKTVTSGAFLMWGARARFVDERFGCVLE